MKKIILLILIVTIVFTSTFVFGHNGGGLHDLNARDISYYKKSNPQILDRNHTKVSNRIIVSNDPIHPYIHELMLNPKGDIIINLHLTH